MHYRSRFSVQSSLVYRELLSSIIGYEMEPSKLKSFIYLLGKHLLTIHFPDTVLGAVHMGENKPHYAE